MIWVFQVEKIEHIKITILFLVRGNFEIYFKTKTRQKKKKKKNRQIQSSAILTSVSAKSGDI